MPSFRPFPSPSARGFTLMEMLVATLVFLIIVVLIAQITNGAAAVVHNAKRLDAESESQLIFNRMALDFGRMLKRPDVDYSTFKQPSATLGAQYGSLVEPANLQLSNDQCAFYSQTTGYFSGTTQPSGQQKADVSLVAYMIAKDPTSGTPVLRRMGKGLGWEPDAGGAWLSVSYLPNLLTALDSTLFSSDVDYQTVGNLVFRLEYNYLLKPSSTKPAILSITPWDTRTPNSHTSPNGFADVSAIVVTVALLDAENRAVVSNYTSLTSSLPDALDGQAVSSQWTLKVDASNFATTASIPPRAAKAVRIYERYFYLDTLHQSQP